MSHTNALKLYIKLVKITATNACLGKACRNKIQKTKIQKNNKLYYLLLATGGPVVAPKVPDCVDIGHTASDTCDAMVGMTQIRWLDLQEF